MSKHTPGPWATLGALGLEVRPEFPARGSTVGFAPLAKVVGDTRLMDEAEREANAHLIAAAPDLLEALKQLRSASRRYLEEQTPSDAAWASGEPGVLEVVDAAIAKATGEPQ